MSIASASAVSQGIIAILALVPDSVVKKIADDLLDKVEEAVEDSDTEWDDAVVVPVVNRVRGLLAIPDLPDGD